MRFLLSVSLVMCSLLAAGGIIVTMRSFSRQPAVLAAGASRQDASPDNGTAVSLSGNWQMSWTGLKGEQRQGTMELKQDGNKLSGSLEGERGAASLTGSVQGNRVSITVKMRRRQAAFSGTVEGDKMSGATQRGAAWTATREQ
ncbi:MAG TPA: hypothetical protein VL990_09525 [Acidobacteriaceae bacterium]|nr:hypothetical protein [Acidobacteriaceae bacterium]